MWLKWFLVGLLAAEPLLKIALIDEPRKPLTKGDAIGCAVGNALLIAGLLHYWR